MARNEQLIRQHKILQILERYRFGRSLEEIRQELVDELGLASLAPADGAPRSGSLAGRRNRRRCA